MYKTDFICTYKLMDEEDQDLMYRIQYLQAFGLETYNNGKIDEIIENIYIDLKDNSKFKQIIEKHPHHHESSSPVTLLLLFSFDTFDLFHLCLIDYFGKGEISEKRMGDLLNKYDDMNK